MPNQRDIIMRYGRIVSLAAIAGALLSTSALARPYPPLPSPHWVPGSTKGYVVPRGTVSGTWAPLVNNFPGTTPDTAAQLTDGSILMHDGCTPDWYKLTPDNTGSYHNGTWTKMASMASNYAPLYFASQMLPDGRLIVNGGEDNKGCTNVNPTLR